MCELLRTVKEKTGLTGNQIAIKLNVSPELVSSWNRDKSEPNGKNTLKLMKLGNIDRDEAIKLMQHGNSNVSLLLVTSFCSLAVLALVQHSEILYIMLNRLIVKIERKLHRIGFKFSSQAVSVNLF